MSRLPFAVPSFTLSASADVSVTCLRTCTPRSPLPPCAYSLLIWIMNIVYRRYHAPYCGKQFWDIPYDLCQRILNVKGETRFQGWLFQKVCAGFTCMALYLSKAWSHNLARIWVYLATYLWYTGTVTTNRSLYKMLWKSSKRQQIWRCAKPNVNQRIYYWGPQQLICMMSWGSKSNRKRKWKVGICTCSNFSWPN